MQATKSDVYQIVTDKVLEALEQGTVPWHKPWNTETGLPKNLTTGKVYRGINPFLLGMSAAIQGYDSPYWLTYKQASDRGAQVRKGEKSTLVVFWKRLDPIAGAKKIIDPETSEELMSLGASMVLRYFNVFNSCQVDNLDVPKVEKISNKWEPLDQCENIANRYLDNGPSLIQGGSRAAYSPSQDQIYMPTRESFESAHGYYSTLFHEMTHSTGHGNRLARKDLLESHSFGDASYSKEELVAEMGSAMLSGVTGIEQQTVSNSAAYVKSWLSVLKGDRRMVVNAAAQAQKAADLIQGIKYAE